MLSEFPVRDLPRARPPLAPASDLREGAMKTLMQEEVVKVPKGIKIKVKSKVVEVSGKHGTLTRSFKHLPMLNSCCSHIANLFTGVEQRFQYKLRLVYAHFPINVTITNNGGTVEIRNFLGEKIVRTVNMLSGVKVEKSTATKDELLITGADIDLTSRSAALVHQSCLVKNKDIRKFLDGIYVSSHGAIED